MFKLSFITILSLIIALNAFSQTSPHGDKLTLKCDVCHISKNWTTITIKKEFFDHNKTGFSLIAEHQKLACVKCHTDLNFNNLKSKSECISCHLDVHQLTLGVDCGRCHTQPTWSVKNITQIHNQSRFPLLGNHAHLDCILCHKSASLLRFDPMGTECVDCHTTDYYATTKPSHVASKFPKDCTLCHKESNWQSATFDHNNTEFPLIGGHIGLECIQCHSKGYAKIPTTCVSCHLTNYNATTNPNHTLAKFSTDCKTCHNVSAWSPSTFNHNTSTTFPLTGAHIGVTCISCHSNGYSGGTSTTCVGCHSTNYNTTTNPNHKTAKFSTDCQTCHNVTVWSPSTLNHNTATTFPLTGAHIGVACVSCHPTGYGVIPTTCVSCHQTNYNATTNPNHKTAKFSTDCQTCHNVTVWSPSTLNHNTATTFPLTGSHIGVACVSCHPTGYGVIPTTCVSCHQTNYNATTNPNHKTAKFSTDCQTCHNVTVWSPSTLNHNTATTFPLTGAHIGVACVSCHPTGYGVIPTTCVSCHQTNYNATTSPNHKTAKFSTDCQTCHNVTVWSPSTLNHNTATTFPLTGAHIGVACVSCHPTGYGVIPTTCVSCHQTNYNATTNPNHKTAKLSTDCQTCHNVTVWSPSTLNHNTATTFPLTGAHIGVACVSCHPTGYGVIPTTCVSCHQTNYNATTNPNHITAKFSTDCQTCHNVTTWSPSTLNHNTATTFPLTGAHIGVACVSCHKNGYGVIPTTCVSCHLTNYNATTIPNHITAKFPTTCETCHTVTSWVPSTFNHNTSTSFPLSGAHTGVACVSCHTNGYAGGTPTTCVGCHQVNYNATTNPNHITAKFSTDCQTCHNVTTWSPSTLNHNTATTFPLTGAHIGVACVSCHKNGYGVIPTTCVSCHQTNYNATTNPNHITAKFSTDCQTCHNVTTWSPSTLNHNTATTFPLTGAHIGVACVSCHKNGYGVIPTTCVSCHLTNYNATTIPNHITAKFPTACETCHTVTSWVPSTFNHNTSTSFPLSGAHTGVACVSCHTNGYAGGTPTTCVGCHQVNYNATTNPNHTIAKFSTDCQTCHNVTTWSPSTLNHNTATTFPLTGAHIGVACVSCHKNGYGVIPTTCVSCHQTNYNATTNPNHITAKFSTDCQTCHNVTTWSPSTLNHNTATTFPLTGAHIGVTCVSCHKNGYGVIPTTCVSCHLTNYNATTIPNHITAKFPTTCETCHTVTSWVPSTFNHNTSTSFPLSGAHTGVACVSCHTNGYAGGTPTTCVGCHQVNYNATTNPNHTIAKFSTDCQTCHNVTTWSPSTFNHSTATTFPLTGSHIGVACVSCHPTGYGVIPTTCVSCHQTNYNATTNPNHITAKFSTDCQTCHNVTTWSPSTFNHSTATTFPLTGSHIGVACVSCHPTGYGVIPTTCVSCHQTNYNATTNPNHITAKFSTDCLTCHNVTAWSPSTLNHNTATIFPLTGSHIGVACVSCHKNGYGVIPTTCVSCHLTNYNATTNPNHVTAKFPTSCETCHTVTSWVPSTFNHTTSTSFPLSGAHTGVACVSCHTNGYAGGTPTTCVGCHQANYNATTNPNHVTAKFSTDCKICHNVTTWSPSTFNHSTATTFPLTGSHIGVACVSCHPTGYGVIPTTCVSCHQTNYNATTNPNHITAKFSTDCLTCHNVTAWSPSTLNHNTATIFPLTGSHIGVACVSCHKNGYGVIPTTCVSCHLTNYNATTNPNHITAKFPTTCETCHTVTSWVPSTFNHTTSTSFPLSGAHTGVACVSCHTNGYAGGTPTTCVGCHQANYNATTNPNHVTAKFSTDCQTCHNVTTWSPSTLNHNTATTFPLTGSHIGVACVSCHKNGYGVIPTTCVSCHQTNYNATTNPNHITAKFSTDCQTCHNVTTWSPSTLNHNTATTFPLTGAHIGVACVSCHKNGYGVIPTTCVSCHLTNYNATTIPNHITAKFPTTCETCHTVTSWVPSTFNHTTSTSFPLSGAHTGVACISCHTNGYAGGTPTTCVGCHQANFNATTNPNHVTAKFSTDCQTCHNVTTWSPSTFNHSTATTFPLTGSHIGVACVSCHPTGYGVIPTTCVSCHQTNYNATTNPNHITAKFSTDCLTCHNVTTWSPSTLNHNTATIFPLTGSHIGVACVSCHKNGYGVIPTTCVSCHLTNYNATTNPNHITAKFPTSCETCHTVTSWVPSTFNHNTSTSFPLSGAHTGVACVSCHTNGYAGGTPTTCVGCHQANFNATTNPNHVTAKFSTDCQTCHNMTTWSPSTFNHNNATTFPLAGSHIGVACSLCHTNGYAGIPTTCVSCHQTNYNSTTNPNHITAKFPTTCETCHTVTAWVPSTFNHNTSTAFPLTGLHKGVACISCHPTGYTAIPTTCVSCHQINYNATTNPNHVTAKFATTCETCHTTTAWVPSTFNHSTATTFPITGAHIGVACVNCHTSGYSVIPTTCVSCHLTTYNATTNPNHVISKFPTTCETCHSTSNWTSSTFNHSTTTSFPLTGAHIPLTCVQCHPTNYNVIPTTCVSCHLATFNATINPNHIGAKFAKTCETCHTTTNWTSATYNHITVATIPLTGNHNLACSICHTTPTNYAIFSCRQTGCHANAHNSSQGSTGCYSCHPQGRT